MQALHPFEIQGGGRDAPRLCLREANEQPSEPEERSRRQLIGIKGLPPAEPMRPHQQLALSPDTTSAHEHQPLGPCRRLPVPAAEQEPGTRPFETREQSTAEHQESELQTVATGPQTAAQKRQGKQQPIASAIELQLRKIAPAKYRAAGAARWS